MKHGKHRTAWSLLVLLLGALVSLCATGCGGAGKAGTPSASTSSPPPARSATILTTRTIPPGQAFRGDGDADNPGDIDGNGDVDPGIDKDSDYPTPSSYRFPDPDDKATFTYGHRPSPAEERAIAGTVKRFYAEGVAGNGAAACLLMLPTFARSIPESYAGAAGPSYLRGAKTCAAVVSMLFRHFREELADAVTVVKVGVEGSNAQAILASRTMRASHIFLARQGRSWKIQQLLGQPLP